MGVAVRLALGLSFRGVGGGAGTSMSLNPELSFGAGNCRVGSPFSSVLQGARVLVVSSTWHYR